MTTTDLLNLFIKQAGFVSWAVIPADRYQAGYRRLVHYEQYRNTPFVSGTENKLKDRITPKAHFEWARSIIMLLYPYGASPEQVPDKLEDKKARGKMARIAWGEDYHNVVERAIDDLAEKLVDQNFISKKYNTFIDTSPLAERELAYRGGLGYPGRNNCLINDEYGSFVVIGGIVSSTSLLKVGEETKHLYHQCFNCSNCIKACPGNALGWKDQRAEIDLENCVAYLTVKKGIIPREKRQFFGDYLYGCDICQIVCPANSGIITNFPFWGSEELTQYQLYPSLSKVLNMDNKEFREHFSDNAVFWRGRTNLQRNAIIAAGNLAFTSLIQDLEKALYDQREIIRAHAIWAIEKNYPKLSNPKQAQIVNKFKQMVNMEKNQIVQKELAESLNNLGFETF